MTGTEGAGTTGATGGTTAVTDADAAGAVRPAGGDLEGGDLEVAGSAGAVAAGGARLRALAGDAGMATAEYAIATLAAVGFAGLLVVILKGNEVKGLLTGIVRQALGG
ncbi:DUF4244 domain-containing protein [Cellulomonas telluris]|uniref:DUF4244 domain-containing protein n=1 Tax=Cellulomonas telluris TaxID=2306636 RepID=UPI0010A807BA|nr:DUF4244 domain-containing protein [Cellulomonas telluris]